MYVPIVHGFDLHAVYKQLKIFNFLVGSIPISDMNT